MFGLLILVVAIVLCAPLVFFGPMAAEAMLPVLGGAQESAPAVEALFQIVIFGTLLVMGLIAGGLSGFNAARLGRQPLVGAVAGFLLGVLGVGAAAGYAWLAGTLGSQPTSPNLALILWGSLLVLLQAGSEEVFFRGWLQRVLVEQWGASAGILVAALAFAFLHVMGGARSPITLINLFLGGMLFGLLAHQGRGIAGAVAAHFAWNWSEMMVLGLSPNPGIGSFGALLDLELGGIALWGGSEEGLNASLAMTLTLGALILPLLVFSRGSARPVTPAAATAPDRSGPARL